MPQAVEVDLDVLSGRCGATMTEMVTDLLEGKAPGQQLSGTGMSQAMGATSRDLDAESGQARAHNGTNAGRQKRANGRVKTQKQLAINASWAGFLQVPDNRVANDWIQGILLRTALLWARHIELLTSPVQILETKSGNLATAQAVDCEQQYDRPVAKVDGTVTGEALDELLNLVPAGPEGDPPGHICAAT